MLHPAYLDSWYNMLHNRVEYNAGITLFVETFPAQEEGDKPILWFTVDSIKTDATYFATVLANAVFDWWEDTIDDVDFPTPTTLYEQAMEHYCGTITDPTWAFLSDWLAEAYNVGIDIVLDKSNKYDHRIWNENDEHMRRHGFEFVGYDYVKVGQPLDKSVVAGIIDDENLSQGESE